MHSQQQPTITAGTSERNTKQYDYIITGAGCAGLSLVMHMIDSGAFENKKILLVDKDRKQQNDRTWCFWQKSPGLFDAIVYKEWPQLLFHEDCFSGPLNIAPYTYKMIRGIDFYRHCFSIIERQPNIEIIFGEVDNIETNGAGSSVHINGKMYQGSFVFNSIIKGKPALKNKELWLLQHFKGWIIETGEDCFDPQQATLMDFRIDQSRGTAFCYVMPFTTTRALIEYTLFTPSLLQQDAYDESLRSYIKNQLGISQYKISEEEFGIIPMTNYRFSPGQGSIVNIGTIGGRTKASSGYTFQFIQKHSKAIVDALIKKGNPFVAGEHRRFHFYDSVLLHILYHNKLPGSKIFADLFKRNRAAQVLKFLDNETSFSEELKIISTLPTWPFMKAAYKQVM
ncbi:MAG TPA: lycopene cyclase family protein [Flavisolibacter sp.]|nr:lycopene cyclase family protein [Flavisolibacter sp.]